MRKIMLFCAGGMSTSLLVTKMEKEAAVRGIYPYVAVNETTPAELMVTGLVKKEFATLQTLNVPVAIATGIVGRLPGLAAPWTMPIILSGFYIGNGDVRVVLLQIVNFVVTGIIYFPFIAAWDKKKYAEEQGAE